MSDSMSLDGDVEKLTTHYDNWAATYDADVASHDYGLPPTIVAVLRSTSDSPLFADGSFDPLDPELTIVDAGCGTGLVGVELAAAGYLIIDGLDLSAEMARQARARGVYRVVESGFDLTKPPPTRWREMADVTVVAGVFTVGHLPPAALQTMLQIVRVGGLLVTSTRRAYYDETDYQQVSDDLVSAGVLELVTRVDDAPYTMDSTGHYWVYRRLR